MDVKLQNRYETGNSVTIIGSFSGNMQLLGICLSYQRTMDIVRILSEDHHIEVQVWADELRERIKGESHKVSWSPISNVDEEGYQMVDQQESEVDEQESECDAEVDETDIDLNLDNLLVSAHKVNNPRLMSTSDNFSHHIFF